jgi:hypothetical protein
VTLHGKNRGGREIFMAERKQAGEVGAPYWEGGGVEVEGAVPSACGAERREQAGNSGTAAR